MGVGGREKRNVPQSFYSGGYVHVWTVGPNFPTSIIQCVFIQHSLPLLCFMPFSCSLLDCSASFYTFFLNYFNLFKISFHFSFSPYLTHSLSLSHSFALNSSPLACLEKLSTETTSLRRIKYASTPFANSKHCAGLLMSATFRSPALPVVLSPPFIFPSLLRTSTPLLLSSFSCVVEEIILQMMPVARFIVLEKVRVSQERKCTWGTNEVWGDPNSA